MTRVLTALLPIAVIALLAPSTVTLAATPFPVSIENCGTVTTYTHSPKRAFTMNQAATEIMLALGLHDRMVGTAFLDDAILEEYADAYAAIPVRTTGIPPVTSCSMPSLISCMRPSKAHSPTRLTACGICWTRAWAATCRRPGARGATD